MREDGQISKRGANMAHFSKWVRPGYWRVTATANPESNVFVTAFTNGSKLVIVAINKTSAGVYLPVSVEGAGSGAFSTWVTDANRTLAPYNRVVMTNGAFNTELPAQSIRTFVTE
jgi:glucuronoarabinoxylan endo-1,4-beta-xylanase